MAVVVTCWGLSQLGMAFSPNFGSLYATRFLLGFFEAACLPLFTLVTVSWYRRSEQVSRIAAWLVFILFFIPIFYLQVFSSLDS